MLILFTPIVICVDAFVGIIFACKKKWGAFFLCAVFAIGLNLYTEWYSVSVSSNRIERELRVLTYNLNSDGEYLANNKDSLRGLLSFVDSVDADVVLLQEYDRKWNSQLDEELERRYPYNSSTLKWEWGDYKVVYSRMPIDNVVFAPRDIAPHVMFFDVNVNGRTVRFINCHLASNHFTVNLKNKESSCLDYWKSLKEGYDKRHVQVEMIKDSLSSVCGKFPVIVAGDMNDVGGSYTLNTLESCGLSDAWWTGGNGIGITYDKYHLKLRLDHILYSKDFELVNVSVLHVKFSDHYPLVTDFVFKKNLDGSF